MWYKVKVHDAEISKKSHKIKSHRYTKASSSPSLSLNYYYYFVFRAGSSVGLEFALVHITWMMCAQVWSSIVSEKESFVMDNLLVGEELNQNTSNYSTFCASSANFIATSFVRTIHWRCAPKSTLEFLNNHFSFCVCNKKIMLQIDPTRLDNQA